MYFITVILKNVSPDQLHWNQLLEMQIPGPHLKLTEPETLWVGSSDSDAP